MSDKLQEINHENVLAKMNTYLHVWDLVGVINENLTDEEERNAMLDVLEGAQLLIEQLEQAQAAMQWQSLETIPKDGISILVLDADGSVYEASWNGWGWDYPCADQHGCGCCAGDKGEPVKWMKLPNTEIEVKGNA